MAKVTNKTSAMIYLTNPEHSPRIATIPFPAKELSGNGRIDYALSESFRIPHDNPPRWLFVLTAYLDESGQESTEHVFIGGFLGNDEQWRSFADEWKSALAPREHLHMADLRWGKPQRIRKLLQRLGPIPYKHKLEPILGGVRVSDYADLIQGTIDERLMGGYIAALYPLVVQVLRWIPDHERIELIFEAQERYEALANMVLSDVANNQHDPVLMTKDGVPKLANWRFVPKGSTSLIEPADYFVYALTQFYRDKHSEKSQLCMSIRNDQENPTAIGAIMNRDQIRGIIQVTRHFVNWKMIEGIDLSPKTPQEQKEFEEFVRAVIDWKPRK